LWLGTQDQIIENIFQKSARAVSGAGGITSFFPHQPSGDRLCAGNLDQ
jgi:hypothetical protein